MTLQSRTITSHPFLLALAVAAAIFGLMLVLTAVVGVDVTGPGYEIVPDPAGSLPF